MREDGFESRGERMEMAQMEVAGFDPDFADAAEGLAAGAPVRAPSDEEGFAG